MATIAPVVPATNSDDRFFMATALAMAFVIVAGFSLHFAMGRSTFAARPLVHLHGVAFMGWVALFVTQARLATAGPLTLHRRLGWIGAGWMVLLIVLGLAITADVTMRGTAPFFFRPQFFLVANPLAMLCFALLTGAAISMRRKTDWHKRLHICGMAAIIGPGFGRLLPMPLLGPNAFDIAALAGLMFPVAGIVRDLRREGRVHPAWYVGITAIVGAVVLAHLIAFSPVGDWIYASVTAGHPGAEVPGLEFGPPPPGM